MANLLQKLAMPGSPEAMSTTSEDSFHSIQPQPAQAEPSTQTTPRAFLLRHTCLQLRTELIRSIDIGHIYDVDTFLDHLASEMARSGAENPSKAPGFYDTQLEPVAVGKATTQYVPQLVQVCHAKRIPYPEFHIEGQADTAVFWGSLTVVGQTVTLTDRCRSKKEAKERLAEKALEIVKAAEALPKENRVAALSGEEQVNWVGKLLGK